MVAWNVWADAAGQNKQHTAAKNVAKLDRETEELHHETVGLDLSRLIQQGRQAKGLTQKELATVSTTHSLQTAFRATLVSLCVSYIFILSNRQHLQCFHTIGWVAERSSTL